MFDSVLIANRGEIARRIIRTLRRLGIRSIAVHEPPDRLSPHVLEADEARPVASYLDVEAILAAARESGAVALHPGYGFLSENPALARACDRNGIVFIGPGADAVQLMGDKVAAKQAAATAGVPVVPGLTPEQARTSEDYPLLVKAAAGGGGRGMRVVHRPADLDEAIAAAQREARAGFGDDRVFIERFLPRARHLEVQVIGDHHGTVLHLGERECSLQRRHQKVVEESPSPAVTPELRRVLGEEAVALARAAGYTNAGTVEFIADADDPAVHFFLEMNARLQVEHPVTELVTGLDLVELQLRAAAGEPLGLTQDDVRLTGHAIEARVTAEDATRDFLPAAGTVLLYDPPRSEPGLRVDDAIVTGTEVTTGYDSLLAKVIAHGEDRARALVRLERALAQTTILGVTTTTAYLRGLLADPDVRDGRLDTGLIERRGTPPPPIDDAGVAVATGMLIVAQRAQTAGGEPFHRADGWRLGGRRAGSWWRLAVGGGDPVEVAVSTEQAAMVTPLGPGRFLIDGRGEWRLAQTGDVAWIGHGGCAWPVRLVSSTSGQEGGGDGALRAPMPGQVLLVRAAPGDRLSAGDPVLVLESMKMELVLSAPFDGELAELHVAAGDAVALDQPLARIEAS